MTNLKKSKVKAEFLLVGNGERFTPSIATDLLDILPNRQMLKGEIIRMTRAGKKIVEKTIHGL